jgi:hypothetical protein
MGLQDVARLAFTPEWLTWEISEALAALDGSQAAKKEATVLRMAQAIANGEPPTGVFAHPGACSRAVWYGKYKDGKHLPGWKDDPAIQTALALATERARWWVRVRQGRAVQDSLDILVNGSEDAARQLVSMVKMGALVFDFGVDGMEIRKAEVGHVLEASKQILDRVSALTAPKGTTTLDLDSGIKQALEKVYGDDSNTDPA